MWPALRIDQHHARMMEWPTRFFPARSSLRLAADGSVDLRQHRGRICTSPSRACRGMPAVRSRRQLPRSQATMTESRSAPMRLNCSDNLSTVASFLCRSPSASPNLCREPGTTSEAFSFLAPLAGPAETVTTNSRLLPPELPCLPRPRAAVHRSLRRPFSIRRRTVGRKGNGYSNHASSS